MNIKQMSIGELQRAKKEYNLTMNEGGDGYNPYDQELSRRYNEEVFKNNAARLKTPQGQLDELNHRLEVECGSIARESFGDEVIDTKRSEIIAEINKLETQINTEFLEKWPIDVFETRKNEWNAWVISQGEKISYAAVAAREKQQGWNRNDLKRAKELHSKNKI